MSSTNKTTKVQLNQWVATDPVLREDFNSDNAKIDAAFRDVDSGFNSANASISALGTSILELPNSRITEHRFTTNAQQVNIDLGVNLWDYRRINIIAVLKTASTASNGQDGAYLILNEMTSGYRYNTVAGSDSNHPGLSYFYAGSANVVGHTANFELYISKSDVTSRRIIGAKTEVFFQTGAMGYRLNSDTSYGSYTTTSADAITSIGFMMSNASSRLLNGHVQVYGIK